MPEPGETMDYTNPSGKTYKRVWIICPECGEGRWVVDIIGDQVLFRDSNSEPRLVPADQVITQEEAPRAFEIWLSLHKRNYR